MEKFTLNCLEYYGLVSLHKINDVFEKLQVKSNHLQIHGLTILLFPNLM